MFAAAQRALLKLFRMMPRRIRRQMVRTAAPSFTVGAICIIERQDGALLLVRQAYRSGWGFPGGLTKRGEEPPDTARREVAEEVGLKIEPAGEPAVVIDPLPQRVDVVFRARPLTADEASRALPRSPEIDEVDWFQPDALPQLQYETAMAMEARDRLNGHHAGAAGAAVTDL